VDKAVKEEKRARRQGLPSDQIKEFSRKKKKAIKDARRADWRRAVHEAKDKGRGIWGLVRWAKERSHLPSEPPTVPPLARASRPREPATTFEDKVTAFYERFCPPEPEGSDIGVQDRDYPAEVEPMPQVTEGMVVDALAKMAPFKAPGADGIAMGFLQAMGKPIVCALQSLTQACWDWQYVPDVFRIARIVPLRKLGRGKYWEVKNWRPISLLNTIGKVMEAVTARCLQDIAENHGLLPNTQMGARREHSTETAIDMLLSQIRTTWASGGVATLLSMDMTGAYDHVIKDRLTHILREKGVPAGLTGWVHSFMSNRRTTFMFDGQESELLNIAAGIPQGSPISPILFLFYNSELLDICNPRDIRVHGLGFVDDVNLIAWGKTTRGNCNNLERVHERCLEWADRHGAQFAPDKYELMHLTRSPRRFDLDQTLQLGEIVKRPVVEVRVLGLILDPKLQWMAHTKHLIEKMATQKNALTRLTGSTWGIPMLQARQVYTMVIRPAIAHAAHAWHQPDTDKGRGTTPTRRLQKVQNECLRVVTGGFKATPIKSLETLAHVPPLDLYLSSRVAIYRKKARDSGMDDLIRKKCNRIRSSLRGPRGCADREKVGHPYTVRKGWVEEWVGTEQENGGGGRSTKETLQGKWEDRWRAAARNTSEAIQQPPDKRVLLLHEGLHKAESSVLTQVRTGKIGLADFLHRIGVPEATSPACACGYERETARHTTVFCPRYRATRNQLLVDGRLDFKRLLTEKEGVSKLTRWWIRSGRLNQFQLANELIT
jgi:reverse transcriptase-like protein